MIRRIAVPLLRQLAGMYPVVTVTGPRQSGKTTLCRQTFPEKRWVSLEALDTREAARADPRGFLASVQEGAIIDEVQNVPELLSYLQTEVDERPEHGRFILTGSQHFGLVGRVSQTLAGRTGVMELLPLSTDELSLFEGAPTELFSTLWQGGYPRIAEQRIPADRWLQDYFATYVQRDVRQVASIGDLEAFTTFVRLCAGRTGQELNLSSLGADAGISQPTARAWLSVLEATYVCFRVPPWHRNLNKRLVKAPKLHFVDVGLACHLLGIRTPDQLALHPLRGALFESFVASEIAKARLHRGFPLSLFHFRESKGTEVDLVVERGHDIVAVEAKSGATVGSDFFDELDRFAALVERSSEHRPVTKVLVYGGSDQSTRTGTRVTPWNHIHNVDWDG